MADIVPPPIHPSRAPFPEWAETFWLRVDRSGPCWLWTTRLKTNGYGQFYRAQESWGTVVAHRIAYIWSRGSIPAGTVLDHLCRVRHCVNPEHLEPVTNRENIMRGTSLVAHYAARTQCDKGHELPPYTPGFSRRCFPCQNEYARARRFSEPTESPDGATCAGCGRVRHLRVNGLIHKHRLETGAVCEGSGRPPAEEAS